MKGEGFMEDKTILVLGGSYEHLKLGQTILDMGCRLVVTDYLPTSPVKEIADAAYQVNVVDEESLSRLCKEEGVDGVVSTSIDFCMRPYQRLCKRVGLPCLGDEIAYNVLSDKNMFKSTCAEYGVGTPRAFSLDAACCDKEGPLPYELFVKPASRSGSQGASICTTYEELRDAFAKASDSSANAQALAEQYLGGLEGILIVVYFEDGKAFLQQTADLYFGDESAGLQNVAMAYRAPSKHTRMYLENVHDRLVAMLKGIGITQGPACFQGFVRDDDILFYDPGRRFPGGEYERAFKEATGIDMVKKVIEFSVTGKTTDKYGKLEDDSYMLNGKVSFRFFICAREGTISRIKGLDFLDSVPEVVFTAVYRGVGARIEATCDTRQRVMQIVLLADEIERIREIVEEAYRHVSVLDETGEEMIIGRIPIGSIE